jgi:hypothetical protein
MQPSRASKPHYRRGSPTRFSQIGIGVTRRHLPPLVATSTPLPVAVSPSCSPLADAASIRLDIAIQIFDVVPGGSSHLNYR